MADPLTITLAAVTLATAIKDIVELVQKIRESVSQISRNDRDSLRLSEDIIRTMRRIQEFCDNNPDALENAELKTSLVEMKREMQDVHDNICGMLPSRAKNKLFIRMWLKAQAWMRQRQVKEDIRELRDRVNQYHMEFTTSSVIRIEGGVHQLSSASKCIVRRLSIHRSDVQHPGDTLEQGVLHLRVTDQRMATFIGSGPVGNLNSSPELTGDLISDLYIRFQLERINKLLIDLPTIQFNAIESFSEQCIQPFLVNGSLGYWERSIARDVVVIASHRILPIIQSGFTTLTVQEAAWGMGELLLDLQDLGMHADAATIGHWTVQLSRILVKSCSTIYIPHLAQALLDLSFSYLKLDDLDAAQSVISESYTHIQTLLSDAPKNREFIILHCRILTALGKLALGKRDKAGAHQFFEDAIMRFEMLLQPCITGDALLLEVSWNKERMYLALRDYSRTLCDLFYILKSLDRLFDAITVAKKVIAVIRTIIGAYTECYMEEELASMLHQLSVSDFRSIIPLQDAHLYAKEATTLYRKFYIQDPPEHNLHLYNALEQMGVILEQMDHRDDALLVRQEMTDLARQITNDQTFLARALGVFSSDLDFLERYDEAVAMRLESIKLLRSIHKTISFEEAQSHYNLLVSLTNAGRHQEALREVEEAISQYRILAFKDPDQYLTILANSLSHLSEILNTTGDYSWALTEGHESLKLYESIIDSRPECLKNYMGCLKINMIIASNLCCPTKSVERGEDVIRQLRQLAVQHPTEIDLELTKAIHTYSLLLYDLDMVPESIDWCQQSLELHNSHISKDVNSLKKHIDCLVDLNAYLCAQGYFSHALGTLAKATWILDKNVAEYPGSILTLINIKQRRAHILHDLGRYTEALEDINIAITLCREMASSKIEDLVRCLTFSSLLHRLNGNPDAAIKAAREAMQHSHGQSMSTYLALALQELAEGLADSGKEDEAQKITEELESMDPSWKINIVALWGCSVRLFAKGKLQDDTDFLTVKRYFEKNMKKGPGDSPRYTRFLWSLGVFHCAHGRHEDGEAAAAELKQLTMKLRAYPEVGGAVERRLEYERNRPSWKPILSKLDLSCGHQDGC